MRFRERSRLAALRRMQWFLDENSTALGDVNQSLSRQALDDVVADLQSRDAAQDSAATQAKSLTKLKHERRTDLRRHHMRPIAAIARSTLAHTPLIAKLRVPVNMASDSSLITAGHGMADAAEQYPEAFAGERLPVDFIDQLRAAADAVREAQVRRDLFQVEVTQATRGVADALSRASNVVKVLDALVVKQLKGKPDLLAGWRRAKRVRAKPGRKQRAKR